MSSLERERGPAGLEHLGLPVNKLNTDLMFGNGDDAEGSECELFTGEHLVVGGNELEVLTREERDGAGM